jgi:hypothetical protein
MIKIKIQAPDTGRNEPTFRPLFFIKDRLRDYSIDITNSDDYDFLFIGMDDFIDKSRSLEESIEWGAENLSKITGDYFLFDGSDSTSLMGSYEVFEQSDAIYLFKNQLRKKKKDYLQSCVHGKWFWEEGSNLDLSYNITEQQWSNIKLTGWNLGHLLPQYKNFVSVSTTKNIDICGIFQTHHKYNTDHGSRNDNFYTQHRQSLDDMLKQLQEDYNVVRDQRPFEIYIKELQNSKIGISPFGMGEVCFRDFENIQYGTILMKPDMSKINTIPDIYKDEDTYIAVNYNWSNLAERIDYVLSNFNFLNEKINYTVREQFNNKYDYEKLCMHWYNIFNTLSQVKEID